MTQGDPTNRETPGGTGLRSFASFVLAASGAVLVLAGLGCLVIVPLTGRPVTREVLVGCGVSWFVSCVGAIPIALAISARSKQMANAILGSTAARFIVVLLLVVPLALSGWFDRVALVLAVAVSYLCLLVIDTYMAVRTLSRLNTTERP